MQPGSTLTNEINDETFEGVVSIAEARFEHWRRTVGLFAGPIAFLLVWLLPMGGLSSEAHRLAAVVTLVVCWWVTEPIPLPATALVGVTLAALAGIAPAAEAFAPFANPIIFLFIGSFMISKAMSTHGLDRHLAFALLSLPLVRGDENRIRLAVAGLTVMVSAWMSNTATTAMMVPVAIGVLDATRADRARSGRSPVAVGFLLTIAYGAGIGGMMTPVGTPPNLIAIGMLDRVTGIRLDFVTWMMVAVPIATAMAAAMYVLSTLMFKGGATAAPASSYIDREQAGARRWSPGKRNCVIVFGVAVTLWVTPGVITAAGWTSPVARGIAARLDEGVVAIAAASLLFLLPIDWSRRRFTLDWHGASGIDWGTILLFGGGLSLGRLMFETGLASVLGNGLVALTGAESLWAVTAVGIVASIALTEVSSNTAAANMLVPVILTICAAGGVNPVPPVIGVALGASMAFMLPISTPPNAIVYSTGIVPVTQMMRFGLLVDLVGAGILFIGLRLLCPLLGFS